MNYQDQTTDLLTAVLAEPKLLYIDQWAKRLGRTTQDEEQEARLLRQEGLLHLLSAPHGVLLSPSLKAAVMI